jgi:hypothetical protein
MTVTESKKFQRQIRSYNNAMAFASLGAKVDHTVQGHSGVYTFKIGGSLFHNLPNPVPNSRNEAKFSQIYVIGNNDYKEAALRNHKSGARIDSGLLFRIQQFLSMHNSYAKFYRTVNEELSKNPVATFFLKALNNPNLDQNTYNHPRVNEVAMVLESDDPNKIGPRDVVLRGHSGGVVHVTDLFPGYLALRFPIFFPLGEQGWIPDLNLSKVKGMCIHVKYTKVYRN